MSSPRQLVGAGLALIVVGTSLVLAPASASASRVTGTPNAMVGQDAPPPPWTIPAATGFAYGVAAGEVRTTSAVLWARAGRGGEATLVVARDRALKQVVARQKVTAAAEDDFTLRSVVTGLQPGTRYFYRFTLDGDTSDLGRFTTAFKPGADRPVTFAFSGDAQATPDPLTGEPYFNDFEVFDRMAGEGNDFNVLLGDTIYSDTQVGGEIDGVELVSPWTATTVAEKWSVYRQNLALAPMARFRSAAGTYTHWDDHEFVNNFTVGDDGQPMFDAGRQAFYDYTPLRGYSAQTGLYRHYRWGRNLDVFFLDQSSFRSPLAEPACINPQTGAPDPAPTLPKGVRAGFALLVPSLSWEVSQECFDRIDDPSRTQLGDAQFERFIADLGASKATFKVVMLQGPIQEMFVNQYDRWESYRAARTKLLEAMMKVAPRNVVFLTTDLHANIIGRVRLQTFGEGGPVNTPYREVIAGPIAATTHAGQLNGAYDRPRTAELVRSLFYTAPVDPAGVSGGLGITCANLDTYSYGQVEVSGKKLTVMLKDLDGKRVVSEGSPAVPAGEPCPVVTLKAR